MTLFSAEPMLCPSKVDIPSKVAHHSPGLVKSRIASIACVDKLFLSFRKVAMKTDIQVTDYTFHTLLSWDM